MGHWVTIKGHHVFIKGADAGAEHGIQVGDRVTLQDGTKHKVSAVHSETLVTDKRQHIAVSDVTHIGEHAVQDLKGGQTLGRLVGEYNAFHGTKESGSLGSPAAAVGINKRMDKLMGQINKLMQHPAIPEKVKVQHFGNLK